MLLIPLKMQKMFVLRNGDLYALCLCEPKHKIFKNVFYHWTLIFQFRRKTKISILLQPGKIEIFFIFDKKHRRFFRLFAAKVKHTRLCRAQSRCAKGEVQTSSNCPFSSFCFSVPLLDYPRLALKPSANIQFTAAKNVQSGVVVLDGHKAHLRPLPCLDHFLLAVRSNLFTGFQREILKNRSAGFQSELPECIILCQFRF